jgi:DNA repair exonuclease SbcCD ATPase subunit
MIPGSGLAKTQPSGKRVEMEEEDPFLLKEDPRAKQEEDPFVIKQEPHKKEEDPFALPKEPAHKANVAHEPAAAISPDITLKEVIMPEVRSIQQRISQKIREKLEFIVVNAVPQFPKVSLILGVLAVGCGLAMPIGLFGIGKTLMVVFPLAAIGGFLGYGMRSDKLSKIGIALAAVSIVEAVALPLILSQQRAANDAREQQELLDRTQKAGAALEAEAQKKRDAEAKRIADEQAKQKAAEEAARIEADRKNADWKRQQDELAQKKAAEEAKKAEDARQAKLKAEEELRKKKAEEAAKAAAGVQRAADIEAAKSAYHDVSVKFDDLTLQLSKLQTALKVAKEEMDNKSVILERRNSPVPPSDEELARAQKAYDQLKAEVDKLKGQIPQVKVDLDTVTKEKQKLSDKLDELQK